MKKIITILSVAFILVSLSASCQSKNDLEIDEFIKKIASERYVLVDVRTVEEFKEGYIEGAVNIDYFSTNFSSEISKLGFETSILVYCRSGNRSGKSMKMMYDLGFVEVKHLSCGISGWKAENHKIITNKNEN